MTPLLIKGGKTLSSATCRTERRKQAAPITQHEYLRQVSTLLRTTLAKGNDLTECLMRALPLAKRCAAQVYEIEFLKLGP